DPGDHDARPHGRAALGPRPVRVDQSGPDGRADDGRTRRHDDASAPDPPRKGSRDAHNAQWTQGVVARPRRAGLVGRVDPRRRRGGRDRRGPDRADGRLSLGGRGGGRGWGGTRKRRPPADRRSARRGRRSGERCRPRHRRPRRGHSRRDRAGRLPHRRGRGCHTDPHPGSALRAGPRRSDGRGHRPEAPGPVERARGRSRPRALPRRPGARLGLLPAAGRAHRATLGARVGLDPARPRGGGAAPARDRPASSRARSAL
ncbi:MAG: hypothetical protein AVDCRST_MAG45-2107, partial [uncultured Solirubrobacterales bacterium]